MSGLSVSSLVNVTVNLTPTAAAVRSFGVLAIAGDSLVINASERYRSYPNLEAIAFDFGTTTPEYQAGDLYFSQSPKPPSCLIARWLRTASKGLNDGGILPPSAQLLSNWTTISNGSMVVVIDGVTVNLSGLNFTGVTNLNGVASVITAALSGGQKCSWNGTNFVILSGTTGAGTSATGTITMGSNPSPGAQAAGYIALGGALTNGDTVTINGTAVTFVTGTPIGNQVQLGGTPDITAQNLQNFLQASSDVNIAKNLYSTVTHNPAVGGRYGTTTVTARVVGTGGNAYTLTNTGSANLTVSGATLTGGFASDTLTVNGTLITFVSATPTGSQVLVGPTAAQTAANLQVFLQTSSDANILNATYSTASTITTVTAQVAGTAGNAFTLTKSSTAITLSGATLAGGTLPSSVGFATPLGSGTDISSQLMLTALTSQALVPGYNAETPVQFAALFANLSAGWYGLMFAASVMPTDSQSLSVSDFIEGLDLTRLFGVTTQEPNSMSALSTTDLAYLMDANGYDQSMIQYSSQSPYAVASLFGRAFSVDYTQGNSTITLMFKQEPLVIAEVITPNQALVLQSKNCNVFAAYNDGTTIIQYGTVSSGQFIDTIQGCDWLQNAIQTAAYNLLLTSGKVPQTDAGVNQIVTVVSAVLTQAVNNGLAAPGTWNGPAFGQIITGQFLKNGYYIFAQSVNLQSEADRQARKCPPIQIAVKLGGAIQSIDMLVNVNA